MNRLIALPLSLSLLGAACAGESQGSPDGEPLDTTVVEAELVPDETVEEPPPIAGADPADTVVRVVTAGTFVSPDFGQLDSVAGSGSAFIIDETGLAVTNDHVVAGAASVEVFFDGDDEPVSATVVATSECGDLAVIDLAGDGYSTLGWANDEAEAGVGIRAAGYPEGEPGLTLTGGIVARVDNDGATPWASIATLLRHDADLAPGNSGGPILDDEGRIVGVNVAASDAGRFAIPTSVARPIVDSLRGGVDVDSIGLNAVAVLDDVTNESGVWVVSVEAGSAAAAAGIEPGDVITRMKGVRVGRDATLADYCSVVRSAGDGELPIEITRDGEFFAGSVRGATAMSEVLDVTDDVIDTATTPPPVVSQPPPAGTAYESFETVTDDSGTISIDVPTAWVDQRTGPVFMGSADRPAISASYDFDAFNDSVNTYSGGLYDQAGATATVFSADLDIEEAFGLLMDNAIPWMFDCTPLEREPFDDGLYVGVMQPFMDCADTSSTVFSIGIKRTGEPGWLLINIFAPTVADLEAAVRIASSFTFEASSVPTTDPSTEAEAEIDDTTTSTDDEPESTVGDAPATTVTVGDDPAEELPETLAIGDDVVGTIGAPPQAGIPTQTDVDGIAMTTYASTATEDDLRAWMDERIAEVGCTDPTKIEMPDDGVEYSVACSVSGEDKFAVVAVMLIEDTDGFQVVVSVLGSNADS